MTKERFPKNQPHQREGTGWKCWPAATRFRGRNIRTVSTFSLDEFIANQARYSDEQVNDIVFKGIHSGDPAIVAHTVEAIGRATVANGPR